MVITGGTAIMMKINLLRKLPIKKDVTLPGMTTNQTSNNCPRCGKEWIDVIATPGLLHRTILCSVCSSIERQIKFTIFE
jgi:hypothetical protein